MTRHKSADGLWVRYRPRRMLVRLLGSSRAANLSHRILCDWVWSGERWPLAEPAHLLPLLNVTAEEYDTVWSELRRLGWRVRGGRVWHPEAAATLNDARRMIASAAASGREGARKRYERDTPNGPQATLQPPHRDPKGTLKGPHRDPIATLCTVNHTPNPTVPDRTLCLKAPEPLRPLRRRGSGQEMPRDGEQQFMAEVREMLRLHDPKAIEREMESWGG